MKTDSTIGKERRPIVEIEDSSSAIELEIDAAELLALGMCLEKCPRVTASGDLHSAAVDLERTQGIEDLSKLSWPLRASFKQTTE